VAADLTVEPDGRVCLAIVPLMKTPATRAAAAAPSSTMARKAPRTATTPCLVKSGLTVKPDGRVALSIAVAPSPARCVAVAVGTLTTKAASAAARLQARSNKTLRKKAKPARGAVKATLTVAADGRVQLSIIPIQLPGAAAKACAKALKTKAARAAAAACASASKTIQRLQALLAKKTPAKSPESTPATVASRAPTPDTKSEATDAGDATTTPETGPPEVTKSNTKQATRAFFDKVSAAFKTTFTKAPAAAPAPADAGAGAGADADAVVVVVLGPAAEQAAKAAAPVKLPLNGFNARLSCALKGAFVKPTACPRAAVA
jgi:hypothetical protein